MKSEVVSRTLEIEESIDAATIFKSFLLLYYAADFNYLYRGAENSIEIVFAGLMYSCSLVSLSRTAASLLFPFILSIEEVMEFTYLYFIILRPDNDPFDADI